MTDFYWRCFSVQKGTNSFQILEFQVTYRICTARVVALECFFPERSAETSFCHWHSTIVVVVCEVNRCQNHTLIREYTLALLSYPLDARCVVQLLFKRMFSLHFLLETFNNWQLNKIFENKKTGNSANNITAKMTTLYFFLFSFLFVNFQCINPTGWYCTPNRLHAKRAHHWRLFPSVWVSQKLHFVLCERVWHSWRWLLPQKGHFLFWEAFFFRAAWWKKKALQVWACVCVRVCYCQGRC